MKILAQDLARLCYNAIQFSAKDSSLGGVVYFFTTGGKLKVYASDDYVAMMDEASAKWEKGDDDDFYLTLKELKELEKALRTIDGEVEISIIEDQVHVDPLIWSGVTVPDPPDFMRVVEIVHSEPNPLAGDYYPASREPFAIRAERFTKFRLLRTPESPSCRDGYPVDFLWDGHLIRWRCGPFLRGVVAPLVRHSFILDGQEIQGITSLYQEEDVLW